MSDTAVRLALIIGVLAIALVVVGAMRLMTRRRPVVIGPAGLGPGVYFFSARTCLECQPARVAIERVLGPGGFVEVAWEEQPETFCDLGIDAVPATVVVSESGSARLFPGMPERVLKVLGP